MTRPIGLSCLFLALFLIGCGSPRPDDLFKENIRQMNDAAAILETVSDQDSLDSAGKKLDDLAQRMVESNRKASRLELDLAEKKKLEAENRTEINAALNRFNAAANKMKSIPGAVSVLARFQRMAKGTL